MVITCIRVSGRSVPIDVRIEPTTPSDKPRPSPTHSTPFVNSSSPNRITIRATITNRVCIAGFSQGRSCPWPGLDRPRGYPRRVVTYIAVVGPSAGKPAEHALGEEVGRRIAGAGAVLVCGGLGGVMEAAAA